MAKRRSPRIDKTSAPLSGKSSRAPWGAGRIALFARLDSITADLAAGWPMTAIYKRHMAGLGISYEGFRKLLHRYASDAMPGRREPAPRSGNKGSAIPKRRESAAPATAPPDTPQDEPPDNATDEQPRGSFRYSPVATEGEIDRLFGSGFFSGKK